MILEDFTQTVMAELTISIGEIINAVKGDASIDGCVCLLEAWLEFRLIGRKSE